MVKPLFDQELREVDSLPEWVTNPEKATSVDNLIDDVLLYHLGKLLKKKRMSIEQLKKESVPVRNRFIALAADKALRTLDSEESLHARAKLKLELRMFASNAQVFINEEESFLGYLENAISENTSPSTLNSVAYTVETLNYLDEKDMLADSFFSDTTSAPKFFKCIPTIRQTETHLKATEARYKISIGTDQEKEFEKEFKKAEQKWFTAVSTSIKLSNDPNVGFNYIQDSLAAELNKIDPEKPKKKVMQKTDWNDQVIYLGIFSREQGQFFERLVDSFAELKTHEINELQDILEKLRKGR